MKNLQAKSVLLMLFAFLSLGYAAKAQGDSTCVDPSLIDPNAICPLIYAPVCGCDGITYDNDCYAINYGGVTSWTVGPCPDLTDSCLMVPAGVDFGLCDMVLGWAMFEGGCVMTSGCGTIGSDGYDYSNYFFEFEYACNSQCDSSIVIGCINPDQINLEIACPQIWDPVCGCDGVTYGNDCEAFNWGGVTTWTPGECGKVQPGCVDMAGVDFGDCDMALGFALLNGVCTSISGCGWLVDGIDYQPYFFDNEFACTEVCGGFVTECFNPAQLDSTYGCIEIFAPVCGCDSITYENSCFAFYAGVSSWTDGPCITDNIFESGSLQFSVAPNPFSDILNIQFQLPLNGNVAVTDMSGKVLLTQTINGTSKLNVNTSELAAGVYFVVFKTDEGNGVFRAMKH